MQSVIDVTELWLHLDRPLDLPDGRAIRGYFGNTYVNRPEFHGHRGNEFVYKHPPIQYKVINGKPLVIGVKEGAYLLRAMPAPAFIDIYNTRIEVKSIDVNNRSFEYGLSDEMTGYTFATPWIGLNEENYKAYLLLREDVVAIEEFLSRILIGNILSMSKSLGYVVNDELRVEPAIVSSGLVRVKPGVRLMSFTGKFRTNFLIPELWGIGKFSSRGYGTIKRL